MKAASLEIAPVQDGGDMVQAMGSFQLGEGAVARLEAGLGKDAERRKACSVVRRILSARMDTQAQGSRQLRPPPRIRDLIDGAMLSAMAAIRSAPAIPFTAAVQSTSATPSTFTIQGRQLTEQGRAPQGPSSAPPSRRSSLPEQLGTERRHPTPAIAAARNTRIGPPAFWFGAALTAAVIAYQVSVQGLVLGSTQSDGAGAKSDPVARLATSPASDDTIPGKPISMRQTGDDQSTLPDHAAPPGYARSVSPPDRSLAAGRRDLDSETVRLLMARGQELLAAGDLASARLLFQRAADADDAGAALAAGSTYDPVILTQFSISSVRPDIGKARAWYKKAKALGSTEAAKRLRLVAGQ